MQCLFWNTNICFELGHRLCTLVRVEVHLPLAIALCVRWGEKPGQLLKQLLTHNTLLEVDLRNQEKLWQGLLVLYLGFFSLFFQTNEPA